MLRLVQLPYEPQHHVQGIEQLLAQRAMFIALYVWNFLFGTWFIGWAAVTFGCPQMAGKFITMAMQGIWGFCLCKWVIFK